MTIGKAIASMNNLNELISITESEHESVRMAIEALETVESLKGELETKKNESEFWEEQALKALEIIRTQRANLNNWKRESISDKAKLGEYKILEGQGLLIKANNGVCEHCKLLADFGGCQVFGYGKDTMEKCRAKFIELEGGVSNE